MARPKQQKSPEVHLKIQFVPRSKHNPNALEKAISNMAREK